MHTNTLDSERRIKHIVGACWRMQSGTGVKWDSCYMLMIACDFTRVTAYLYIHLAT